MLSRKVKYDFKHNMNYYVSNHNLIISKLDEY